VSQAEWIEARKELLRKEKEFTRARDALSEERRNLPWTRIEKPYVFEDASGKHAFGELFDGRSQLIVYHFMFDPSWDAGCKSCSFWADNIERNVIHLAHRDVTVVAVSRAPWPKLDAYKQRMGWSFRWLSSSGSDFNFDLGVSFPADEKEVDYNFTRQPTWGTEAPGISVFYKDDGGAIYRTYSTYSRGLDMMNAGYHYLDLVPKGRDEGGRNQFWLRRRDEYDR
jgi:predicted dithiol-disulfide oxidoreductase (DUF899 family)